MQTEPIIESDGYLNTGYYAIMKLTPNPNAKKIYHQYGGLTCRQFEGNYDVELMTKDNYPVFELTTENAKICDSGWGITSPAGTEKRLSELLGVEVIECCEGLFKLVDGTYIALENCD